MSEQLGNKLNSQLEIILSEGSSGKVLTGRKKLGWEFLLKRHLALPPSNLPKIGKLPPKGGSAKTWVLGAPYKSPVTGGIRVLS